MTFQPLELVLISTPIGFLGSGKGGGVELTISSLVKGLLALNHKVTLVAPEGSFLPSGCSKAQVIHVSGVDQPSWQHRPLEAPVQIPCDGVLPKLISKALEVGRDADAVLNFGYDWLPVWLTSRVEVALFHLISMGNVSNAMKSEIEELFKYQKGRLAFHTYRQASDYSLSSQPIVLGNGFDLSNYNFQLDNTGPLGWAGRVAPEKGLEDAVSVASSLGDKLLVWGIIEDPEYASEIEKSCSEGIIEWRGFLKTNDFQKELGACRAFLNTPKWNEAYGNVVVEALACGVPVVAYDRGGPGELIIQGLTGFLVTPDDVNSMKKAVSQIVRINRKDCRSWVERSASHENFARSIVNWIKGDISIRRAYI